MSETEKGNAIRIIVEIPCSSKPAPCGIVHDLLSSTHCSVCGERTYWGSTREDAIAIAKYDSRMAAETIAGLTARENRYLDFIAELVIDHRPPTQADLARARELAEEHGWGRFSKEMVRRLNEADKKAFS